MGRKNLKYSFFIISSYHYIIILHCVITSAYCCDEKACKYGTAIGTQVGSSIAAVGGIACAFTFGIGCLVAAGGAIAAAATTAGAELCDECSEDQSGVPLEKLDEILRTQKENFQNLSKTEINNHLENLRWFQRLSATQKKLLTGQAVLKINQQKILKDLTTLIANGKQLQKSIDMSQIISLYGDSISNLLYIQTLFDDMDKDEFGGIVDDFNSDDFIETTNDLRVGSKRSMKDVIKMLTSGHPLKSESIWEVDSSYCSRTQAEYFSTLLYSAFCLRRIALYMEGKSMSQREAQRFERDVKKVKR